VTAAASPNGERSLFARAHASVDVLYREIAKFGAVGAIAFVVDFGVFNLMRTGIIGGDHGLAEKPLTAKTISVLAATIVAWLGNRYWTFRHRRRASARREFALFGVMNIGGLAISLACLGFSHYVLGLTSTLADNVAGNVIGLGLGTLFRFWAYRQLVFTTSDEQQLILGPEGSEDGEDGDSAHPKDAGPAPAQPAGSGPTERRIGLGILEPRMVLDLRDHARPNREQPAADPASAQRRQS
jgi:putative flippase GtrA